MRNILNLGSEIGLSLNREAMRKGVIVTRVCYGPYQTKVRGRRWNHFIDVDVDGRLHRSPLIANWKRARYLHRYATRQLNRFMKQFNPA